MTDSNKIHKPLVTLGFQETDFDQDELTSDFFPNKVGGKPVSSWLSWLDLGNLPLNSDFKCDVCEEQMSFLLQFYAPWSDHARTYHRMLFVFCCQKARCHRYRVFRSQLPKVNDYYEADQEDRRYEEGFAVSKTKQDARQPQCTFCGCAAPTRCGNCRRVHYCGKDHQSRDWELGHREQCKQNNHTLAKRKAEFHYKEFLIVCDDIEQTPVVLVTNKHTNQDGGQDDGGHDEDEVEDDYESEEEEDGETASAAPGKELALREGDSGNVTMDHEALENYQDYLAETGKDNEFSEKTFTNLKDRQLAIFKQTTSSDRDQILRYCRDVNYQTLWVSEKNVPTDSDIPCCPNCNGERSLEMQILPQLLYFLDIDSNQVSSIHDIDFGILSIYTCKNSCEYDNKTKGIQEEFIWKQDFTK
ncbi:hypothetical protein PPL_09059 [Heterostelium album PN500]|uniref:MYND-type domain-containing protein n=1 Tax=Heterostelium pallidum (strain ATCC 26659 / Pp 5 / PN500) TaxID=670386 RepID=D3BKH8_HETP5|nr:hypothetical protein PPL_09059 [Heterostelium album PN500]EFA78408.1 hypothetical protein PPL_09059 [Heterostelium album PN500]|eukprot:XP_020430533.1 hypothetical protein PPL_09059 [Heterostelium album PN500]